MPKSVFTDAYATLLDVLIETRKGLGVSQAELARRIGREQPFISLIERGVRRIDVVEFYAIVSALGADPVEVFANLAGKLPKEVKIS